MIDHLSFSKELEICLLCICCSAPSTVIWPTVQLYTHNKNHCTQIICTLLIAPASNSHGNFMLLGDWWWCHHFGLLYLIDVQILNDFFKYWGVTDSKKITVFLAHDLFVYNWKDLIPCHHFGLGTLCDWCSNPKWLLGILRCQRIKLNHLW